MADSPKRDANYVIGTSDQEQDRLKQQGDAVGPITERLMRQAGLGSGMRVLDVGCGIGDVTLIASRLVGPSGEGRLRMRLTMAISLAACLIHMAQAQTIVPDLVVSNANAITVDDDQSRVQAFAVLNGRFVAVGSSEEVRALAGKDTKVIDVNGNTIVPGFIDAHIHPRPIYPPSSPHYRVDLRPDATPTMDSLIAALKARAEVTPKGQWIVGERYQDTKLGRHPTREDLDRASTDHPILIGHSSGHVSAVNSLALERAKITSETPDPPGGAFDRDADGTPNGVLREGAARSIVFRAGPALPKPTKADELEGLQHCFRQFLAEGITGIGVAGASPSDLALYQRAIQSGAPAPRITVYMREQHLPALETLQLHHGFGDDRLQINGIKLYHGNSLSGRTCWLYEPYDKINPETGKRDYYGIPPDRSQEKLDELVQSIHDAGLQAAIHANGDREIDMVLDAYEKAFATNPRVDHRHRIEHASVVNESILQRAKDLDIVLALHSYIYEHGDKMEEYGAKRWPFMHANRSATDLGIVVAGNSDWGVSAADPLLRIQSLVTRTTAEGKTYAAEQCVTPEEAIRMWTLNSAFTHFQDEELGSIEEGKQADFVVISGDPTKVSPSTIKDLNVTHTYIAGELVYQSD